MKNRIIEIKGFEPSSEETQYLQLKLTQVQDESPSHSFISVKLEKIDNAFEGLASIFFGPADPIVANANASTLEEMVQELSFKIRTQIKSWKVDRFAADCV